MKLIFGTSRQGQAAAPPLNIQLPSISGIVRQGAVLTASAGIWQGNPAPTYLIEWQIE